MYTYSAHAGRKYSKCDVKYSKFIYWGTEERMSRWQLRGRFSCWSLRSAKELKCPLNIQFQCVRALLHEAIGKYFSKRKLAGRKQVRARCQQKKHFGCPKSHVLCTVYIHTYKIMQATQNTFIPVTYLHTGRNWSNTGT